MSENSGDSCERAEGNPGEKFYDIAVAEPDASVAGWGSDAVFLISSVEVDEAIFCIGICGVKTLQPEDSGEDAVFFGAGRGDGSGVDPVLEYRPKRCSLPKFLSNPKPAGRGLEASWFKSETKF